MRPTEPHSLEVHPAGDACRAVLGRLAAAALLGWALGCAHPGPVLAAEVSLEVPPRVEPGRTFEVAWQGPDAAGDFIAIAEPGAAASGFLDYARTSAGSPAVLEAPAAGAYEIRYVSAAALEVLARTGLRVGAAQGAAISAPAEVEAGGEVAVAIARPGGPADYLTIVEAGAPDHALGPYARLRGASEVTLEAPGTPGSYEVRHVHGSSHSVLARAPLAVRPAASAGSVPVSGEADGEGAALVPERREAAIAASPAARPEAELMALVAVDRGRSFRVAWTGPDGEGDRVAIVPEGGGPTEALGSRPVVEGSPLGLVAPASPGSYQIVYLHGVGGEVLARRDLEVR